MERIKQAIEKAKQQGDDIPERKQNVAVPPAPTSEISEISYSQTRVVELNRRHLPTDATELVLNTEDMKTASRFWNSRRLMLTRADNLDLNYEPQAFASGDLSFLAQTKMHTMFHTYVLRHQSTTNGERSCGGVPELEHSHRAAAHRRDRRDFKYRALPMAGEG